MAKTRFLFIFWQKSWWKVFNRLWKTLWKTLQFVNSGSNNWLNVEILDYLYMYYSLISTSGSLKLRKMFKTFSPLNCAEKGSKIQVCLCSTMAVQFPRKEQVAGSIPATSSRKRNRYRQIPVFFFDRIQEGIESERVSALNKQSGGLFVAGRAWAAAKAS